jgi:hypothetical protein
MEVLPRGGDGYEQHVRELLPKALAKIACRPEQRGLDTAVSMPWDTTAS